MSDWRRVSFHKVRKQPTSFNERAWMSWEWSAQKQGGRGSRVAIQLVSSRFVRNSHERPNNYIKINYHERSKSRTSKFVKMEILLYVDCTVTVLLHTLCDSPIILRQTGWCLFFWEYPKIRREKKNPINVCCTAVARWTLWGGYKGGESPCHRLPHDVEINDALQTRLYSVHTLIQPTDRAH